MSSTVSMNFALISSSNILPRDRLKSVFENCITELGGDILGNHLYIDGVDLGSLTFNQRIVLTFSFEINNQRRMQLREQIRNLFTRRVSIAQENYISELKKEEESIRNQALIAEEMEASLDAIEKKIEQSVKGITRQKKSECEAIKEELIEAAISQGYVVEEENTDQGVQLQFVRRSY